MPIIAIALFIAAALGGGTAYAAQSSLPGDALWNFKTSVNENVEGVFAQNTKAKAYLDLKLASERLDEAQTLAADGTLNTEARADLQANFDVHAKNLAALIAKLEADGHASDAVDLAARFQAQLAKHATDIRASATTTAQAEVEPLLTTLRATLEDAATISEHASAQAELRGGNAGDQPSDEATQNADSEARLEGSTSASASSSSDGTQVHTGTSVRGGTGGIQTTEDGQVIGI